MTLRASVGTYLIVMSVFLLATTLTSVKAGERTVLFFEDFDSYPDGAYLSGGGYGDWVGRWGGNITVSAEESVSSPHSAKMDNNLGCWESGLYHLLPPHPVVWYSADIMGKATGRIGCHSYDVHIWLNNPDDTGTVGITLESTEEGGYIWGIGLVGFTWWSTGVMPTILEAGYPEHVGRWISVKVKLDRNLNQADFWVDGIHRATLPVNPAYPLSNSIGLGCGEGIGYVDNIMVFTYDNLWITKHRPDTLVASPLDHIEITFSRSIDENTFTAEDVNIVTPSGVIPREQITINPVDANTYQINFPGQSETGEYHVFIGPHIQDDNGDEMDQDMDGVCGEDLDDRYNGTFTIIPRIDSALRFDGDDDFVIVPDDDSLDLSNGMTLEAWISSDSTLGSRVIVSKWNDNTWDHSYIFKDHNISDKLRIELSKSSHSDLANLAGKTSITLGTWTHVATTFDSNIVKLYFNGIEDGFQSAKGTIRNSVTKLLIGAALGLDWTGENYIGLIDEVRIWNYARTEDEIRSTMHTTLTGFEPGLVGYWNFNEPNINSQIVNDFSWNGNDGILGFTIQRESDDPVRVVSTAPLSSLTEKSSTESELHETLYGREAILQNGQVVGDINGVFDFNNFDTVIINTGPWAGKGFSKGQFQATLEGAAYTGQWNGVLFLKPQERKIYLKGATSGEISATVEGYLTESVPDSNVYDQYQATWKIGRIGNITTSATVNLNGTLIYQDSSEFPATELHILQSSIEGAVSGHYAGPLSSVLNHIRIADSNNPYFGEGFSIISYVSESGQGQGWTYDKVTSPGIVEMKGLFDSPLFGIVSGTLDERNLPRSLFATIERIDLGLPPMADLEVTTWGPTRVSPGQTIDYIIEYRNDGLKSATEAIIYFYPDLLLVYKSASKGAYYNNYAHRVTWDLGALPAKSIGYLSVQVEIPKGLPGHLPLENRAYILDIILHSTEENGMGNGICFDPTDTNGNKDFEQFAHDNNAKWFKLYANTNFITGPLETYLASKDITTPRNGVGGTSEVVGYRPQWIGFSGSATTFINQAKQGRITGDVLYVVSLQALTQEDIHAAKAQFNKIIVYQGDDLIPDTFQKGEMSREALILSGLLLKPPDDRIEDLVKKIEEAEGNKTLDYLQIFPQEEGNRIKITWTDITSTEFIITRTIQPEEGIEVLTIPGIKHEEWIPVLTQFKEKYGRLPSGNDLDKLKEIFKKFRDRTSSRFPQEIITANDPNRKLGPDGRVLPSERLNYKVEYENEGEGIAFGVYFTDTFDEDLDDSTLEIGPVIDVNTGLQIAPPGTYNPATRTITWFVGQVDPNQGGYAALSANIKPDAPLGTEIINFATVYFPSVPEETRTNGVVSIVIPFGDIDQDGDVDFGDYAVLANQWLQSPGVPSADIAPNIGDGIVDFRDLALLTEHWLEGAQLAEYDLCPYDPNKTEPGACDCGVPDIDVNGDGIADCGFKYGDVNGDGEINAYDAALTSQCSEGLIELQDLQRFAADVDGNGCISAVDADLIAQYAVGLITVFPVELMNPKPTVVPTCTCP